MMTLGTSFLLTYTYIYGKLDALGAFEIRMSLYGCLHHTMNKNKKH